nr:gamma-aminobutyric acid receptor subunit rho-2-like [Lepeophtheirus salmonis]
MDKISAKESCNLIGGEISIKIISHLQKFLWTSFSKYMINMVLQGLQYLSPDDKPVFKWDIGQPDGDEEQNCVAYLPSDKRIHDVECTQKFQFNCETLLYTLFTLRGICDENFEIESKYYFDAWTPHHTFVFHGFKGNKIFLEGKRWIIVSRFNPGKILAFYNGTKTFPVGVNPWYVTGYCGGDYKFEERIYLKLSKCEEHEFTCNNGDCIPLDRICNNFWDCLDESDENYCSNIETKNYRKEFPPSLSYRSNKLLIKVQLTLFDITAIKQLEDVLTIHFLFRLDWKDHRLDFMRLNESNPSILTEKEKASIWIPMVSFLNSAGSITTLIVDPLAEVSIHKSTTAQGKISPMSTIHEALTFNGNEAEIRYKRAFEFPIHCKFDFGFYPFDTQICKIEVSLSSRDQRMAVLNPINEAKNIQALYKNINILQFYIYDMYTEMVGSEGEKFVAYIVFKRLFTNIFTTTYIPTLCLQIVALITLFISEDRFDTTVNVTLTATLVMYTLYQSVSSSLPSTAYNKMIDYWLIFSLIMPFVVFVLEVLIELLNQSLESGPSKLKLRLKVFLTRFCKTLIIGVTIIFDVTYWVYNIITYNSVSN